jgi:hypothetical protein
MIDFYIIYARVGNKNIRVKHMSMLVIIPCIGSLVIFLIISIYIYLLFNPEINSLNEKKNMVSYSYVLKFFLRYLISATGISTMILSAVISLWFVHIDQTIQANTQILSRMSPSNSSYLNKNLSN